MLLNFSNHPSDKWDEKQLSAAISTYGNVIDIPFPSVDEAGDDNYIIGLAEKYSDYIIGFNDKHEKITVHIMGEMTLTFAIVRKLQELNIECIASTSRRIVTELSPGNKDVRFEFERFRKYTSL